MKRFYSIAVIEPLDRDFPSVIRVLFTVPGVGTLRFGWHKHSGAPELDQFKQHANRLYQELWRFAYGDENTIAELPQNKEGWHVLWLAVRGGK